MPDNIPEWIGSFEHASLATPESKESFAKYAKNYETEGDAIVAGHSHKKLVGTAYKLPESMDKLPDDNMRGEFRTGALKVLGSVENIDGLKEFNFYAGKPDGYEPTDKDKAVAEVFAQHIVDTKMPQGMAGKTVELYNTIMAKAEKDAVDQFVANAEATDKKRTEDLKGEANVKIVDENIKRMFRSEAGLSSEEFETIAETLVEGKYTHSLPYLKALGNIAAKLVKEGTTETGGAGGGGEETKTGPTPYEAKKANWAKSPSMWGKESDTWDMQSNETKRIFGHGKEAKK